MNTSDLQDSVPIIIAIFVIVAIFSFTIPILRERRLGQQVAYFLVYITLLGTLTDLIFEWPAQIGIGIVVLLGMAVGYLALNRRA